MEATLKLFRALPIESRESKVNDELAKKTIKCGFIFTPEVVANYSNYGELIRMVGKVVGLGAEQINSSFHKSWVKVKEAGIEQLVLEQIVHYLTTYGKERLARHGIQWDVDVYIPDEALDIPGVKLDTIKLAVIRGYTKEELKDKLIQLLESGIALAEDTIQAVVEVAMFVGLNEEETGRVKNKEVKAALYDYLGLFPENPTEFLRFAVFRATSTTLLIKSRGLIESIKESNNLNVTKLFSDYEAKYGLERLAEIFYRFKPIFLAFRTNQRMKVMINRTRRLAAKYHKPLPEDFLNSITAKVARGEEIDAARLQAELGRVNIFRKIRLAYALKFRTKDVESILYRIRNGKGYATEFTFAKQDGAKAILDVVLDSITDDIGVNVRGKKVYIPGYINYSLPATEKQFTGVFPSGTYVSLPSDMIAGIHWDNVEGNRIDLDLSLVSAGIKIGWDSLYRTAERDVLFSGDVTDAEDGASELFYVKKQSKKAFIVFVNYYNFDAKIPVPFKILVARETVRDFRQNYTVNPNNVVAVSNTVIDKKQKILGLLVTTTKENRFYFTETNIGRSITSGDTDFAKHSRQYLFDYYANSISLRDVLTRAGAEVISEKSEDEYIDLSPEVLEKDSILALLREEQTAP